jgi:rRNA maturation RNase YbeY
MISAMHQHPRRRFSVAETIRVVQAIQKSERRNFRTVSVVFTTSSFLRSINKQFLGHDRTTDIVTFALEERNREAELYINLDLAKAQAQRYRVSYATEVRRLIVHGMLHLCGYRDRSRSQITAMRLRENTYLERLERTNR